MEEQAVLSSKPAATFPKQAVVIIHGMGEQRPMDTIKGFVRAVWEYDEVLTKNGLPNEAEVWSKPDFRTGSLELRRITTRESIPTNKYPAGVRSDFYELYWADLSGGPTWYQVLDWIAGLLFRNFWAARLDSRTVVEGSAEFLALQNLEKTVAELEKAPADVERSAAIANFLTAQRIFGETLRARTKPKEDEPDRRWLITDLITLGSPLSHANFLIAKSEDDLRRRQNEREDPTSPPIREQLVGDAISKAKAAKFTLDENRPQLFCFPFGEKKQWQLHHAAPFAAVRWTNIYDPAIAVFCGDIISGPIVPAFGQGVVDVSLKKLRGRQSLRFTHTRYWAQYSKSTTPPQVLALRDAIDLGAQRFPYDNIQG